MYQKFPLRLIFNHPIISPRCLASSQVDSFKPHIVVEQSIPSYILTSRHTKHSWVHILSEPSLLMTSALLSIQSTPSPTLSGALSSAALVKS